MLATTTRDPKQLINVTVVAKIRLGNIAAGLDSLRRSPIVETGAKDPLGLVARDAL